MKYLLSIIFWIITFSVKAQFNYETVDKGLLFKSSDDRVKMKLSFRVQSLASFETNESGNDQEMKAMVRRMRLKSKGYIYNPKFEYKLELAISNRDQGITKDASRVSDGSKIVLDAVLKYNINKKHQIWFGQTKLPGNRERVISSMALQFVDRSNVNSKFNIDRDFGVQYRLKQKIGNMPLTLAAAVSTGEGRNITAVNEENGLSYTGRLEFYPFGKFTSKGDYFSADLKRENKPKLAIGVTSCLNENTNRSGGQLGSFVELADSNGNFIAPQHVAGNLDEMFNSMNDLGGDVDAPEFTDWHGGSTQIRLGSPVSMPRSSCDSNPNNTCSSGLHVGAPGYVKGFGGSGGSWGFRLWFLNTEKIHLPKEGNFS